MPWMRLPFVGLTWRALVPHGPLPIWNRRSGSVLLYAVSSVFPWICLMYRSTSSSIVWKFNDRRTSWLVSLKTTLCEKLNMNSVSSSAQLDFLSALDCLILPELKHCSTSPHNFIWTISSWVCERPPLATTFRNSATLGRYFNTTNGSMSPTIKRRLTVSNAKPSNTSPTVPVALVRRKVTIYLRKSIARVLLSCLFCLFQLSNFRWKEECHWC